MFIVLAAVAGLVVLMGLMIYLADFARASRRDSLFLPASSRGTRRARRVAGIYVRGGELPPAARTRGDDELVGS
ncbi:hypothetical protein [Spirillospora sp. CA-294931]|uniref:hypothetical protein n=1 Tax=Spirillospora sp. CA-294931 TaxID=3240042 RepID=UPI003D92268C